MFTAYGYYYGIFYPSDSPAYKPPDSEEIPDITGDCFAPIGQPDNYRGFLYQTTKLRADYKLYA